MMLLLSILIECVKKKDILLVFSQSTNVLNTIEYYVRQEFSDWASGMDYFRLDGDTKAKDRKRICCLFGSGPYEENAIPK